MIAIGWKDGGCSDDAAGRAFVSPATVSCEIVNFVTATPVSP
jgi:hypothetical protein